MVKKITVLASVLAFFSVSSFALACGSSCKDKGSKDDVKTELVSESSFDTQCGDSCGSGKGDKKA